MHILTTSTHLNIVGPNQQWKGGGGHIGVAGINSGNSGGYYKGLVPAPDGTIYLVDINETHYWGSF